MSKEMKLLEHFWAHDIHYQSIPGDIAEYHGFRMYSDGEKYQGQKYRMGIEDNTPEFDTLDEVIKRIDRDYVKGNGKKLALCDISMSVTCPHCGWENVTTLERDQMKAEKVEVVCSGSDCDHSFFIKPKDVMAKVLTATGYVAPT